MSLTIVGAGFGRTGTKSMQQALEMLGLGPCHHMSVLLEDPEQQALWNGFGQGETPDWDQAFAGFRSAVDWPAAYYWQEIAQHYPDAKVLLTLRSAESWWNSFSKTILTHLDRMRGTDVWIDAVIREKIMAGHPEDRATAIAAFNANTAKVRAHVPPNRLIVHEVGDGWGPLCQGLGLPTPAAPYPQSNSTQNFLDYHAALKAAAESGA